MQVLPNKIYVFFFYGLIMCTETAPWMEGMEGIEFFLMNETSFKYFGNMSTNLMILRQLLWIFVFFVSTIGFIEVYNSIPSILIGWIYSYMPKHSWFVCHGNKYLTINDKNQKIRNLRICSLDRHDVIKNGHRLETVKNVQMTVNPSSVYQLLCTKL